MIDGENQSNSEQDVVIRAAFPFRPLNGFLVISREIETTGQPWCGTVLSVCASMADQIFVGDRVLYNPIDTTSRYISFGKLKGYLVNTQELFGFWDTEKVKQIFDAQRMDKKNKVTHSVVVPLEVAPVSASV